jgi:hypothetical protein
VPTPATPRPATSSAARELRRHLLHLVLAVVALDAVFIVVRELVDVARWTEGRQQAFTIVWVALTLAVVSVFLSRIRAARIRARRARAGLR